MSLMLAGSIAVRDWWWLISDLEAVQIVLMCLVALAGEPSQVC